MDDYWEENHLTKPQQYIVCAACKCGNILLTGARHFDKVMRDIIECLPEDMWDNTKVEQGFIDQFGDFLTREEAMKIAKANGQKIDMERNGGNGKDLYSEGLY